MQCSHKCPGWMFSLHTSEWLSQTVIIRSHPSIRDLSSYCPRRLFEAYLDINVCSTTSIVYLTFRCDSYVGHKHYTECYLGIHCECDILYSITWTLLYCIVLYCDVLYCTVYYCTILYCIVGSCTYGNVLCCIVV